MKFTLALTAKDYIAYQLYYFSTKDNTVKRRKKNSSILSLIFLVLAAFQYSMNEVPIAAGFTTFAIFYFVYARYYYSVLVKKSLEKSITIAVENKIGKPSTIEFTEDEVKIASSAGYTTIFMNDLEKVTETPDYFYPTFRIYDTLIVPKAQIQDVTEVRKYFQILCHSRNLEFDDQLNWKWK